MIQALVGLARRVLDVHGLAVTAAHGAAASPLADPGRDEGDRRRRGSPGAFAALLGEAGRPRADDGQVAADPVQGEVFAAPPPQAREPMASLLPALVRRVAWEGDADRGSVRLEMGAGPLAGATLLLESEGGRLRVVLADPDGVDLEAWRARIGARLVAAGIHVDAIE